MGWFLGTSRRTGIADAAGRGAVGCQNRAPMGTLHQRPCRVVSGGGADAGCAWPARLVPPYGSMMVTAMLVGSHPKRCPPLVSRTQNGQHEAHQRSVPGLSPVPRQVDELGLPTEPPTARAVFSPFLWFKLHVEIGRLLKARLPPRHQKGSTPVGVLADVWGNKPNPRQRRPS